MKVCSSYKKKDKRITVISKKRREYCYKTEGNRSLEWSLCY
ncbi:MULTISPECIES: hypothetical protein [Bacillus cereus group]|nr:hypothetical protein [Bacillus mycoides]